MDLTFGDRIQALGEGMMSALTFSSFASAAKNSEFCAGLEFALAEFPSWKLGTLGSGTWAHPQIHLVLWLRQ